MKRITTIFIILCMLIMMSGCSKQSTADIYKMMEDESLKKVNSESSGQSEAEVSSGNLERLITEQDYEECNAAYTPELIDYGQTDKVTMGSRNETLSFTVKDTLITDNFDDLKQLTSQYAYDNVRRFLLDVDIDKDSIDEQGHILDSERGVERKALFIKLSVKNENNYEYLFLPSGLYLYSIKTENSVMSYRRVLGKNDGGAHCVDVPDAFTLKGSTRVTLQPGEEKEIVLIYFIEDKWVKQYTKYYDKDKGTYVYKNIVYGDDFSYDNIYLSTQFTHVSNNQNKDRSEFEKTKSLLELDIRQE